MMRTRPSTQVGDCRQFSSDFSIGGSAWHWSCGLRERCHGERCHGEIKDEVFYDEDDEAAAAFAPLPAHPVAL
jgi:hypothetical protein